MSYYQNPEDRKAIIIAAAIIAAAILLLTLTSCGEVRPPAQPVDPPTVADQIRLLGERFLTWGGLILGLGMVIRAVVFAAGLLTFTGLVGGVVGWIVKVLGPFVGLAAVAGGAAVAFGAACVWLSDYMWAVVLAGIAACVACAVYYWPRIRAWIPSRTPDESQTLTPR